MAGGPAYAVSGNAEQFDPLVAENLREFHEDLAAEEKPEGAHTEAEVMEMIEQRKNQSSEGDATDKDTIDHQLEELQKELLNVPKRDRFKMGGDSSFSYTNNYNRAPHGQVDGDSVVETTVYGLVDFGGRRTELSYELRGERNWHVHHQNDNYNTIEQRIRYRRQFFRKLRHSIQSRLSRNSQRTIEVDDDKIRIDSLNRTIMDYEFSRKLSLSTELEFNKRLFTTEPFDQDSTWDVAGAISGVWHLTPKSRISGGYRSVYNTIRTEVGNAVAHEVHLKYFGKVSRKVSSSFDVSLSKQYAKSSVGNNVTTMKLGTGFIWQVTPKMQLSVEAIRELQNSTSNAVASAPGAPEEQTNKPDEHFSNESLNLSINSRLRPKLTLITSVLVSHFRNKITNSQRDLSGLTATNEKRRNITIPISVGLQYAVTRWWNWSVDYTYTHRTSDEQPDDFKIHEFFTRTSMNF
ncbi:MAG: hypothetical protein Q8R76_03935 [Candidatus Omnitrophota bacterium]|nr:hypothetical protein [Candidatus Omnitrophota bacterium]